MTYDIKKDPLPIGSNIFPTGGDLPDPCEHGHAMMAVTYAYHLEYRIASQCRHCGMVVNERKLVTEEI